MTSQQNYNYNEKKNELYSGSRSTTPAYEANTKTESKTLCCKLQFLQFVIFLKSCDSLSQMDFFYEILWCGDIECKNTILNYILIFLLTFFHFVLLFPEEILYVNLILSSSIFSSQFWCCIEHQSWGAERRFLPGTWLHSLISQYSDKLWLTRDCGLYWGLLPESRTFCFNNYDLMWCECRENNFLFKNKDSNFQILF